MSIFRQIPPTAGWPLYPADLFRLFTPDKRAWSLEDDFKNYLSADFAAVTCSGTAAFYLILESLKEISPKRTVVIPAYICPLVPLAVKRAGLKCLVCDITGEDFNFDPAQLRQICSANSDILAVVAAHLGGIPLDFAGLAELSAKSGIFIIEDCALSLGASYEGEKTGALGDFSFFSLCRGKGLTIYEGGLIVAKTSKYAEVIEAKIRQLARDNFFAEGLRLLELAGYWLFYRPQLFWFIFRLPQIFWNLQGEKYKAYIEEFNENFPLNSVGSLRKNFAQLSFYRLEEEIKCQREKAGYYSRGLAEVKGLRIISERAQCRASYPYLVLLFEDERRRNAILGRLDLLGLGVSVVYTSAVADYSYLQGYLHGYAPAARSLAQRQITLSTSRFLTRPDMDLLIGAIKKIAF